MGLLDDAIREHLELKRRHGADPGEVRRQEHEALGPVTRAEPVAVVDAPVAVEPEPEAVAVEPEPVAVEPEPIEPVAVEPEPEPHTGSVRVEDFDEPPIERAGLTPSPEPEPEDELDQTPEFLQETPEHDRLWFEQKPPKDFDF